MQVLRLGARCIQVEVRLLSRTVPGAIARSCVTTVHDVLGYDVFARSRLTARAVQFRKFVADCGRAEIVANGRADLIFQLADRTYASAPIDTLQRCARPYSAAQTNTPLQWSPTCRANQIFAIARSHVVMC